MIILLLAMIYLVNRHRIFIANFSVSRLRLILHAEYFISSNLVFITCQWIVIFNTGATRRTKYYIIALYSLMIVFNTVQFELLLLLLLYGCVHVHEQVVRRFFIFSFLII